MKKTRLVLSIFLLLLLTCGCGKTTGKNDALPAFVPKPGATEWDKITQRNEIRIGVPTLDDTMDNRLIDAFEKAAQLTVTRVVLPWDNSLQNAVQDGTVDMLWGQLPATSDSSTMFRLSNPYFHSTMLYLSHTEDLTVTPDTSVGVLKHSAGQLMAENYFESVNVFHSRDALFYALSQKQVDCILYDNASYENMQTKKDFCHIVKEVPYDLVVAFEHNNHTVASEIEKIMAKIKADGTASDICLKWYLNDYIQK